MLIAVIFYQLIFSP